MEPSEKCEILKIKKYDHAINLILDNHEELSKSIKEIYLKNNKFEIEITELYELFKKTKRYLILRNKFSINLSYASFFISSVALALSLIACL